MPIDPPCTRQEAVTRALKMVRNGGQYVYGTGDFRPRLAGGGLVDLPWTTHSSGLTGTDCAGLAICYAWKLKRNRPGFNKGHWASISDDINVNSAMEDATHKQELFMQVDIPRIGDLLCYPTFTIRDSLGEEHRFIGHTGIVVAIRCKSWMPKAPDYDELDIVQSHGPNKFKPGVVKTDGSLWNKHDEVWPKEAHRTRIIRPKERK